MNQQLDQVCLSGVSSWPKLDGTALIVYLSMTCIFETAHETKTKKLSSYSWSQIFEFSKTSLLLSRILLQNIYLKNGIEIFHFSLL